MNRIDELIALATLGELGDADQAELDAAVAADPAVAVELREALEAAAKLQTTEPVAPPPELRSRVLDLIATTPQEARRVVESTRADVSPTDGSLTGMGPIDESSSAPSVEVPSRDAVVVPLARRRSGQRSIAWLSTAAAAVILVIAGVVFVQRGTDDRPGDQIAAVADAPDAVDRVLTGTLGGRIEVVHSASIGAVAVIGTGLDPVAADETLQLWLVDDDGATSVGTFAPDGDGTVSVRFDDVDPTDLVLGITLEPSGGSETPTLPILAAA